ncbi:MAG: 4-hydroxythreonine-4-phosphate dehydrogenase PdxA [Muribaculaceae bacterium]|nr:4-hydroxythreonine-4-phosphate dehydrogenase PdxA [Muribaculaceae bacterium]
MSDNRIKIGITHGDINGIGYEVILKALDDNRILELCTPVLYGSAKIAAFYRKNFGLTQQPMNQISQAADARIGEYNIINVVSEDTKVEPGVASRAAGEAAFEALERAVADLREGTIDLLVTAPIDKHTMQSERFTFPGHTEYLEASLGSEGEHALMILCNQVMRIALATTHVPVSKVSESLTTEGILEKIESFALSLEKDFGIPHPRIAVLALNPHSGEEGLLGTEEKDIIIPAIEQARTKKINCFGPYPADGFFGNGLFSKFDGVLAMYHDQGLAPFKALAMDEGVNFTAGLDYVRTSPDHGTAFDIAGTGKANPDSMRNAIYTAIDVLRNRRRYHTATRNPLRKQYFEKSKHDNVVLDLTKSSDEQ